MSPAPAADLDAAFTALADSTRRAVIRQLLSEPLRAGELAQRVEMSPPALSRHLRVLREAGLIVEDGVEHDARVRVYKVDLQAFAPVRHWLEEVEAHWHEQLAAFKKYAEASHASAAGRGSKGSKGSKGNMVASRSTRGRPSSARKRPRAEGPRNARSGRTKP